MTRYLAGHGFHVARQELEDQTGLSVALSTGEFRLLLAFVCHPNGALSRQQSLGRTQGPPRLAAAAERFSRAERIEPIRERGSNEIKRAIIEFNRMRKRIDRSVAERTPWWMPWRRINGPPMRRCDSHPAERMILPRADLKRVAKKDARARG